MAHQAAPMPLPPNGGRPMGLGGPAPLPMHGYGPGGAYPMGAPPLSYDLGAQHTQSQSSMMRGGGYSQGMQPMSQQHTQSLSGGFVPPSFNMSNMSMRSPHPGQHQGFSQPSDHLSLSQDSSTAFSEANGGMYYSQPYSQDHAPPT